MHWRQLRSHLRVESRLLRVTRTVRVKGRSLELLNLHLKLLGSVKVLVVDGLTLLLLQLGKLVADCLQSVDGVLDILGQVEVFITDSLVLLLLQLLDLDGGLWVEVIVRVLVGLCSLRHGVVLLSGWQSSLWLLDGDDFTDDVKSNQPDLVEHVEVVEVALVEDQLKQHGFSRHVDRLELSSLEPASLIGIEAEVSDSLELDLVEWNLIGHRLLTAGQERKQFNFGGNFALMRQKLKRFESDELRELNDDFLRVLAELGRLPAS